VLSPLLSNIYLHPLDQLMAREGFEMVRYADDFVILCRSEAEAQRALATRAEIGVPCRSAAGGLSIQRKTVGSRSTI